jgi:hypothetical protein
MVERKEFTVKLIRLNEEKGDILMELEKLRKKVWYSHTTQQFHQIYQKDMKECRVYLYTSSNPLILSQ